jgi:hypothetical protein
LSAYPAKNWKRKEEEEEEEVEMRIDGSKHGVWKVEQS